MSEQSVFDSLKYRIETDASGTRRYYNSAGQLHRLEGPAVEWADGDKLWYQNGQLHRTDGPAVERADGTKAWYQNDRLHHIDGPAVAMYGAMQSGSYTVDDYQKKNSIEP